MDDIENDFTSFKPGSTQTYENSIDLNNEMFSNNPFPKNLKWLHILNVIQHELYPHLASVILNIIHKENIHENDFSDKTIQVILDTIRKNKKLSIHNKEIKYIDDNIKRVRLRRFELIVPENWGPFSMNVVESGIEMYATSLYPTVIGNFRLTKGK